ncbi:MAG: molecular chaperone SurA [Gammaproteobacteria bacterium]|nr:molecular chaperone SurA [Gammaproteobacteria bacterium]
MNKIKYLIALSSLLPAAIYAAEELSETGEMLDGIAAVVNDGVVLKSQLKRQIDRIIVRANEQGMKLPPQDVLEEQVLEQLITEEVQMQRASRVGIEISDQILNSALKRIAEQNGIRFEDLPEMLRKEGVDYGEYRRDMRTQLVLEQLRQIDVVGRISVAPREIEQCIADLEDNVVVNSEYNLSHLLISVPDSATAEDYAEAEAEADEVYQKLLDGADFAEMAIRHSDIASGLEGGRMGWRKGSQLPTLFSDVVGPLGAGKFSKPIRAVSGFHIVKVNEVRGTLERSEIKQKEVRHILVMPNEIIDNETAQQKLRDARARILAGESFAEVAKLVSDDTGSANNGGTMGWVNPGSFVPEFEKVADEIEIGTLSEPFQTRFGWHILEVTDRRTYDNTEEVKERNCVERVRNSKLADESELWVRRIRDEAFVEKRI